MIVIIILLLVIIEYLEGLKESMNCIIIVASTEMNRSGSQAMRLANNIITMQ